MKKITYLILCSFAVFMFSQCQKDKLPTPNSVATITTAARVGAAVVKWKLPSDTNMRYVQVRYLKNGRVIKTNASTYTDTCLVTGLLNKLDYTFEVQSFNSNDVGGDILSAGPVKPIRRTIDTTYTYAEIPLTAAMLTTYTQETSEGPKTNLVDGNIATYWHSAWSGTTAPLPHWIQISFANEVLFGGFQYWMRQGGAASDRPTQWDVQTSTDGTTYTTVWTSLPGLAVDPSTSMFQQLVTRPFKTKFVKVRILTNQGSKTYTNLGEFKALAATTVTIDREIEAETNYK
ncbi:MAG: discoidin domain-containing protein [Mariniphaga sp.]